MRRYLPYKKENKHLSRELRNHSTFGEILLWNQLKARQFFGYQFYRQKPIEKYIVDFYCPALKLVIEIDGIYHQQEEVCIKDKERETDLNKSGLQILRFAEMEVQLEMAQALWKLQVYVKAFESENPECMERNKRHKK